MKKFLLFIVVGLLAGFVSAQQTPTKHLSIDESNRLNGTPKEPTINGKPYSQYKAEQQALKQQRQKQPVSVATDGMIVMVEPNKTNPAAASQKPVTTEQAPMLNSEMLKLPTLNLVQPAVTDPKNNQPAIKENTKPVEKVKPQVPEQFRLPANASWGNAAATEMPVKDKVAIPQVKSDPAQPLNTPLKQEAYKTPSNKQEVKPVPRTAADLEAVKPAQQEAKKSKKPAIEASKAAVQEVKITPQEVDRAPKKD